jgi:tetratricopeptide (TPR) repeat protein
MKWQNDQIKILNSIGALPLLTISIDIILLVCCHFSVCGQRIDSLKALVTVSKTTLQERGYISYELAYEYLEIDLQKAQEYSAKAFDIAKLTGDTLLFVKAGRIGALALARDNANDSSIALSLKILPVAKRNGIESEIKHILNRLGAGYRSKGLYDSSLIYHFESLDLREKSGDLFEISVALNNVGIVYFALKDYDHAISFFTKSLEYKDKIANKYDLDMLFVNLSLCYAYKGQLEVAKEYIDRGFNLCKDNCSEGFLKMAHFNLGLISRGHRDWDGATKHFLLSRKIAKELGDKGYLLDNLVYLVEIARRTNTLKENKYLLDEAENLLNGQIAYPLPSMKLCHQLFESYSKLREFQKMSVFQTKYIQIKDSVFNEELTTSLMKVEAEYLEKANKAKLAAQQEILILNERVINRQKIVNIVVTLVAILSIAFVFLLSQNIKQKKRLNLLLEQKVKERTLELELNHNLLLKSIKERDVQYQRMSNEVRSSLATIKGLGVLVSHDLATANASSYLAKIEETSNNLYQALNHVHGNQVDGVR